MGTFGVDCTKKADFGRIPCIDTILYAIEKPTIARYRHFPSVPYLLSGQILISKTIRI